MRAKHPTQDPAWSPPEMIARAVAVIGLLSIAAAVFLPWFTVPGVTAEPWPVLPLRALCAVTLVTLALRPTFRRRSLLGLCLALLLFPGLVSVWSPTTAGQASWLQAQHDSLTASSGDIYLSQEIKDTAWRNRVDLVNRPLESAIFELPDWTTFDWGRIPDVFEWFGGSVWFASFARLGWVLALAGSAACLLALARWERSARVLLREAAAGFVVACALACGVAAAGILTLHLARTAAAHGDFAAALARLELAARLIPAIREDGHFVLQRGLFAHSLGRATPEAEFFRARMLESRGQLLQAQGAYLDGVARAGQSEALTREYLKAFLGRAADLANSGQLAAAQAIFEQVLTCDPTNLRALYGLQLILVRAGTLPEVAAVQTRLDSVYRTFNNPTKKPVLAFGHENVAFAAQLAGDLAATERALARARQP